MNNKCKDYSYDTCIEKIFRDKCFEFDCSGDLFTKWKSDKAIYVSKTNTVVFEFQHFSLHDKTHSQRILESIYLLLGDDMINKLSVSDLWLLLQCAYYHDIGMTTTFDEMLDFWDNDEDFKEYLAEKLKELSDISDSAQYYNTLDTIIRNAYFNNSKENKKWTSKFEYTQSWALHLKRHITLLMADFIRKKHAERGIQALHRLHVITNNVVEERMYKIVAQVSCAHGKDIEYINTVLKKHEKGFGVSHMHPRFIAMLIRLGDLLDMDNNRFDMKVLEYFGKLPKQSELHMNKHKALEHFSIYNHQIMAEINSSDYEVCRIAGDWFIWLKADVETLILNWNDICPDELIGCAIKRCDLKVFYINENTREKEEFSKTKESEFSIDKHKLLRLLIGTNIYNTELAFLREYIQNAMDASRMGLWIDLKKPQNEFWYKNKIKTEDLTPFDLNEFAFLSFPIFITVSTDWTNMKVRFEIEDCGIGMERDCINAISTIGKSWDGRPMYQKERESMPEWLQPTGGFGIGLQSAFMVTDKVHIRTRSIQETVGSDITLQSPDKGGIIIEHKSYTGKTGTIVSVDMNISDFMDSDKLKSYFGDYRTIDNLYGMFYTGTVEEILKKNLTAMISKLQNTIFPIVLKVNNSAKKVFWGNTYYTDTSNSVIKNTIINLTDNSSIQNQCVFSSKDDRIYGWDMSEDPVSWAVFLDKQTNGDNIYYYYRNILVDSDKASGLPFEVHIDMYDKNVTETLHISRNNFISNRKQQYMNKCLDLLCNYILSVLTNTVSDDKNITNLSENKTLCMFVLLRNLVRNNLQTDEITGDLLNYTLVARKKDEKSSGGQEDEAASALMLVDDGADTNLEPSDVNKNDSVKEIKFSAFYNNLLTLYNDKPKAIYPVVRDSKSLDYEKHKEYIVDEELFDILEYLSKYTKLISTDDNIIIFEKAEKLSLADEASQNLAPINVINDNIFDSIQSDGIITDASLKKDFADIKVYKLPYRSGEIKEGAIISPINIINIEKFNIQLKQDDEITLDQFTNAVKDDIGFDLIILWVAKCLNKPKQLVEMNYNKLIKSIYIKLFSIE